MSGSVRLHREHGLNPTIPVCFFCGEPKNEIALLGAAYKEKAPMHLCIDKTPCDKCKGYMKQGIILIRVRKGSEANPERTGALCVIKEEAAYNIFPSLREHGSRVAFVDDEAWAKVGLPEPEEVSDGK